MLIGRTTLKVTIGDKGRVRDDEKKCMTGHKQSRRKGQVSAS